MCTVSATVQHLQGVSLTINCRMSALQHAHSNIKTPDRILHKSPEFIRSCGNNNNSLYDRCNNSKEQNVPCRDKCDNNKLYLVKTAHRRKSAVELLEASKAEYVKSTSVLNHRQELKHPENLHIGSRPKSAGSARSHLKQSQSDYTLSSNTKAVSGDVFIGGIEKTPSKEGDTFDGPSVAARLSQVLCQQQSADSAEIHTSENGQNYSRAGARSPTSNRVCLTNDLDISNNSNNKLHTQQTSMANSHNSKTVSKERTGDGENSKSFRPSKDFLMPNTYQSLSTSVTVLVEKRCAGSESVSQAANDITVLRRKKKTLHRSQSDLSCRHSRNSSDFSDLSSRLSRTSTELERFFNEMGIDKSVLDPMLKLQKNYKKESDLFESLSSLELNSDARSSCSGVSQGEKTQNDKEVKNSGQTSIVEKNARIIKWLCNVKKAGGPSTQQAS